MRVQKEWEDRVVMEVADIGVGFPADLDFRRTGSLGLQVVVPYSKISGERSS